MARRVTTSMALSCLNYLGMVQVEASFDYRSSPVVSIAAK